MTDQIENYLKEPETELRAVVEKCKQEIQMIRGRGPAIELLENIKVSYYDQWLTLKQLGTFSLKPPLGIEIAVWDKNAVAAITKAVESANLGLTLSGEGNLVRVGLPALTEERRQEFMKLAKKTAESARIQIRSRRDEAIKKLKTAEEKKEINKDQLFKAKEKIQKTVDETNEKIEDLLESKLKELTE